MKQFILTVPPEDDGTVRLYGGDFHYLARVRRCKAGAELPARLPNGEAVRFQISAVKDSYLEGVCLPADSRAADGPAAIVLFQALPKGAKMDMIIRQAAEGGVQGIVPFVSERSVPQPRDTAERLERWRRIIREARQQSGSPASTEIAPPRGLPDLLAYWEGLKARQRRALGLLLHQAPLAQGAFHGYLSGYPELIAALVGPEGGFSPREVACFTAAGFKTVTMGNTILRTETAALYAVASIRIILLENAWWTPRIPGRQ
ncbi:MAG: 16S rRNA (uracil(1498)-N(3))-methyltransferase [Treponema sp.]|jgi:16S rRNA (uracil1498-N3)-methyltransferase|nr:16S rRNA (uracil(1498)-N(3))-methyltransferase [Treponema sp.]